MRSTSPKSKTQRFMARAMTVSQRPEAERALAERMLQRLRGGADVRARKVRRIKAAIKVRHYENALKLSVAIERLAGGKYEYE
ncbi:MAG TPA: hypothetical protein VGR35_18560 [Tepidisphaeraceae bacterium]|nr:hypothetical protein [Tepidisphaeraceae bacterium]